MRKSWLALTFGIVTIAALTIFGLMLLSILFSKVTVSENVGSDIVGTYKDNDPLSTSTLVLKPDGTFFQLLITKAGENYTAAGKWAFDSAENQLQIDTGLSYDDMESPGNFRVNRVGGNFEVQNTYPDRSSSNRSGRR